MGWRSDREDWLAEFDRRSFGVLTRAEAEAMAILSGELGPDYDTEWSVQEWDTARRHAAETMREAFGRLCPVIDEGNRTRRDLLEEQDALRTRLAIVESLLATG
jgi:hypothetical protein